MPRAKFEELGLIVKFGRAVKFKEVFFQCFNRDLLHPKVRVPEVYGWCIDDGQLFVVYRARSRSHA